MSETETERERETEWRERERYVCGGGGGGGGGETEKNGCFGCSLAVVRDTTHIPITSPFTSFLLIRIPSYV
jgi:hypothetical protein